MTPGEIVTRLLLAGVQVSVAFEPDGEYLDLAPAEAVTAELVELVREHKAAIIAWLTAPTLPHKPVVDAWPPLASPTPLDWQRHHEAVYQELQRAAVARAAVRVASVGEVT